ncbi:MAG: hypothetical protein BAJALOKI2v1_420014 [Promethearchaeota archaeon]|nr:MAG: hypothetical protein BAJALOKI2v1_420014 [Candidatus Lokiarchaeota archaeon]
MTTYSKEEEVKANLIIVLEEEEDWVEGWMLMDYYFEDFKYHLEDEIEYTWGSEYADLNEYHLFYIDIDDKNHLKEINTEQEYQEIKEKDEIYLVVLNKEIKYRFIENLPCVFDWFSDYHGINPFYL